MTGCGGARRPRPPCLGHGAGGRGGHGGHGGHSGAGGAGGGGEGRDLPGGEGRALCSPPRSHRRLGLNATERPRWRRDEVRT